MAAHHGHRTLVLGAWGCGAFRNNPHDAADAFASALDAFSGGFVRVVFAVCERFATLPGHLALPVRPGAGGD
ncbi:TIGR02452 family protein [Corallococcus aberystwythensis]|uniref:TIGR02452 family protein n=1 Tax=Corallococcus aberystwythensis TaxID=2316722 RepID=UPI0027B89E30|nr:TIGR02452 family protein [Corallococcus aberystwythensis]